MEHDARGPAGPGTAGRAGLCQQQEVRRQRGRYRQPYQGLEGFVVVIAGNRLQLVLEVAVQLGLERVKLGPAVAQDLDSLFVVQQREEQVLDRHVGVSAHHRLAQGGLQRELKLAPDLTHSFSKSARSG